MPSACFPPPGGSSRTGSSSRPAPALSLTEPFGASPNRLPANRLCPGAKSWEQAIAGLYRRIHAAGPAKGAKLVRQATDYLEGVKFDDRAYLLLATHSGSRNASRMFAVFSAGNHPDPAVCEDGVSIRLFALRCTRLKSQHVAGQPIAFVSGHALKRLFERGADIVENLHAHMVLAFIAVAGFIAGSSDRLADSGLYLRFGEVLLAGGLHEFAWAGPKSGPHAVRIFDVRTVLDVDGIGPARQPQLDQGEIVSDVVSEWLRNDDDLDETTLADRIPALPRHEGHYPATVRGAHGR